jgi:putative DNA primase/helicase
VRVADVRAGFDDSDDQEEDVASPVDLPHTDLGNARRLVADHGSELRFAPQLGQWLHWDGNRWAEDLTGEVHRRAKHTVDSFLTQIASTDGDERRRLVRHWMASQGAARLAAMVTLAATEPAVPVTIGELDGDPWALNVANGVVDLTTGRLHPHRPGDLHTKLAPVAYDETAACPRWDKFLGEVFDDDNELVAFMRRLVGYTLTGDVSEHVLPFAHGVGANGKSTFFGTVQRMLGDYAIQLDPHILMDSGHEQHPTGLTDLRGARLAATVETEAGRRLAEALVKQLTGGDRIRARRMRCDFFEFSPTHKLWVAGNHLPTIVGNDHAIWRRILLIPFTVTFDGDRCDKALPDRLAAEMPGILAWAVAGCLEWRRDGLGVPDAVRRTTGDYRTNEDHVGRFLDECCEVDPGARCSARELRDAYESWCAEVGERPWSAKALGQQLTTRGFDRAKLERGVWSWIGLGVAT